MTRVRGSLSLFFLGVLASVAAAQPNDTITGTVVDTATVATADVTSSTYVPPPPYVARITTQTITSPIVGRWDLSGAVKGSLVVRREDDTLIFSGQAGTKLLSTRSDLQRRQWSFDLGGDSVGIVRRVGSAAGSTAPPTRLLVIKEGPGGTLTASVQANGQAAAEQIARKKEALVAYGTYMPAMKAYAKQMADYWRSKGYEITFIPGDWKGVIDTLVKAQAEGHAYSRFGIVSHGGWDGPMFENGDCQLSSGENDVEFGDFVRAVIRGTTPDAKLVFSACHQGGSNRFEGPYTYYEKYGFPNYRYVDDLAHKTGRVVAGPIGPTSTEYSLRLAKAVEGEGPTVQDTEISNGKGGQDVPPGRIPPRITNRPLGD